MSESGETPGLRRANQLKLLLLWLIPVGLMLAAIVVYQLVQAGYLSLGSKNEGVFVQPPVSLAELSAQTSRGQVKEQAFTGRWNLLIRGGAKCDESCMNTLYLTRQVHIRLDKEANRVHRIYLTDTAQLEPTFAEYLEKEHHYLEPLHVDAKVLAEYDARLAESVKAEDDEQSRPAFYVIDPDGWIMMYYTASHDGGAILKDLKHLLKFSRER